MKKLLLTISLGALILIGASCSKQSLEPNVVVNDLNRIASEELRALGAIPENVDVVGYSAQRLNNGSNNFTLTAWTEHKYYKDAGQWKAIDARLVDNGTTWGMNKASYHTSVGKNSNQGFNFRSVFEGEDITLTLTPDTQNVVAGQVLSDHEIIYPDLFDTGIHQIIRTDNFALEKVVKIDTNPNKALVLKWKINEDYSVSQLRTNSIEFSGTGGDVFVRKASVWDSDGNQQPVNIEVTVQGQDKFLQKTIPKSFLDNAVYPVYTDASLTTDTENGDSEIYRSDLSDWDDTHDNTQGNNAAPTGAYCRINNRYTGAQYWLYRCFLAFDTSSIPVGAVYTSSTIGLYNESRSGTTDTFSVVTSSTQPFSDSTNTGVDDYDQVTVTSTPLKMSNAIGMSYATTSAYNIYDLNTDGLEWLDYKNSASFTGFALRLGFDVDDSAPSAAEREILFHSSENVSGNAPYISIDYSVGGGDQGTVPEATGFIPFY